jgi:hypothetical protein
MDSPEEWHPYLLVGGVVSLSPAEEGRTEALEAGSGAEDGT